MQFKISLVLCILIFSGLCNAEIYKWVDENGRVYFTDEPPEDKKTAQIKVDTEKIGAKLSSDEEIERWNKKPEVKKDKVFPSQTENALRSMQLRSNLKNRHCKNEWSCFSESEDTVCKLRYGAPCKDIYFWHACAVQNDVKTSADRSYYILMKRPISMNSRDLNKPLPLKESVSPSDWKCLSKNGFYCDELTEESRCEEDYFNSCDRLRNWVDHAKDYCDKNRIGECDEVDIYVRFRPLHREERDRQGISNGGGQRIQRDHLYEKIGVTEVNKPKDYPILRQTIDQLPGFHDIDSIGELDCKDDSIVSLGMF